jgi:arginyl-tRNA--protein-N-Asp/Glu arginylyltransferase
MESLFHYVASPSPCGYLPDRRWSLEYEYVGTMTRGEYLVRMLEGWRRFGTMLFRPACATCTSCRPLRVLAERFRPDRSQRRCAKANDGDVRLLIGKPTVSRAKLTLYDRYHAHQTDAKGWPQHPAKDAASYADSFVHHPFPVEEWCYYVGERLIGVGYVDSLPSLEGEPLPAGAGTEEPGGLSAIYFFYDPCERARSPGIWNVLTLLEEAARRGLPYVYLGYYVEGCASMAYKASFSPNQLREVDGIWRDYRA